jgi:hypothetical protein
LKARSLRAGDDNLSKELTAKVLELAQNDINNLIVKYGVNS